MMMTMIMIMMTMLGYCGGLWHWCDASRFFDLGTGSSRSVGAAGVRLRRRVRGAVVEARALGDPAVRTNIDKARAMGGMFLLVV